MQNPMKTDVDPLPERTPVTHRGATSPKVLWGTIGALAVVAVLLASGLLDVLSAARPWQSTLGPLVIRLILGWAAVALIATTGRLTATRAPRPY